MMRKTVLLLALLVGLSAPAAAQAERDSLTGMTWAQIQAMGPDMMRYYVTVVMQGIVAAAGQTSRTWPEEIARTFHYCFAQPPEVLQEMAKRTGPEEAQRLAREVVFTSYLAACAAEKKARAEEKQAQPGQKP